MANAIDREMFNYFTQLNETEKKSVVELLKAFVLGRNSNSSHVSLDQYNKEIDDAMERVRKGDYTTFEDLEKEMQSW